MFRALLIACCLTSFPALADGAAALGELVNQRLSLMKDVAGYKAQQHLPIEDLAQEAKVLASARRRGVWGLNRRRCGLYRRADGRRQGDSVSLSCRLAGEPGNRLAAAPLAQVRPQIAQLSSQILQRLAERLRAGPLGEADRAAFMASVDQVNLSAADKRRLADALLAVKTGSAG